METATMQDVNSTKKRVDQLITAQSTQHKTLVHSISNLNIDRYVTQVNREHINIVMDTVERHTRML